MPICRVFLFTYRRNELLRRAVASLQDQTFSDWVCELHNDDPSDPFPDSLVRDLGDQRITALTHPVNYGPTRTFNLMFRGGIPEKYVSLLEDDNWWNPDFLEVMVREMERRPDVQLGWANMRLWQEQHNGSWRDTGRCVWKDEWGHAPFLFQWPDTRQIRGALHSNGAMLVRAEIAQELLLPDEIPFPVMEAVRDRISRHPLMLVPTPLANFAMTATTSRGNDRAVWGQCQALLAASFFRHVRLTPDAVRAVWDEARESFPRTTGSLITAGLIDRKARYILRYAGVGDWVSFAAGFVRRPWTNWRVLRAKAALPCTWATLDNGTLSTHEYAGRPKRFAQNQFSADAERRK